MYIADLLVLIVKCPTVGNAPSSSIHHHLHQCRLTFLLNPFFPVRVSRLRQFIGPCSHSSQHMCLANVYALHNIRAHDTRTTDTTQRAMKKIPMHGMSERRTDSSDTSVVAWRCCVVCLCFLNVPHLPSVLGTDKLKM